MRKEQIKKIIVSQGLELKNRQKKNENIIEREIFSEIVQDKSSLVVIISGIRRSGKSVLMQSIRDIKKDSDYFLNFEDEKLLNFTVADFEKVEEVFLELFGDQNNFYFDEIQNIPSWERFIRRLHDEGKKVYITGSNASMLSRELGTRLTGRYLPFILYPFSFREFMRFNNIVPVYKHGILLKKEKVKVEKAFIAFMEQGGFPEYLQLKNSRYLSAIYEAILYRDIITRYDLNKEKPLKELTMFLASNIGKPISYNSLAKVIGVKNATTVKEYFGYLENSYLGFLLSKFEYSLKKQIVNPKKMYFIDQKLADIVGFRFSKDRGRFLENIVFIELKRQNADIFYFREKYECDFVIRKGRGVIGAIQVTDVVHEDNRERELLGLIEAMKKFNLKKGLILTDNEEDEVKVGKKKIKIMPIWKWLLEGS